MMSIRFLIIFLFVALAAHGQKRKVISGSLNGVGLQRSYGIVFQYDGMLVGNDVDEAEYLKQKRSNWEMKEPGKGVAFVQKWFDDRTELYKPAFIRGFQKFYKTQIGDDKSKYTLIIRTKRTEPGWFAGVLGHPAELDGECWLVESDDQSNIVAKIAFSNFSGKVTYGGEFTMTTRIQSAYEILGIGLGDFIRRKSK
jgi:hypothetical protein